MSDEGGLGGPEVVANGPGGDARMHVLGGCQLGGAPPALLPGPVLLALALLLAARTRRRK